MTCINIFLVKSMKIVCDVFEKSSGKWKIVKVKKKSSTNRIEIRVDKRKVLVNGDVSGRIKRVVGSCKRHGEVKLAITKSNRQEIEHASGEIQRSSVAAKPKRQGTERMHASGENLNYRRNQSGKEQSEFIRRKQMK